VPSPYTLKKLTDVKDAAIESGFDAIQEARFAKQDLETEGTGVSLHRIKGGKRQPFAHRHKDAEEVYVVLAGSGRVKLDDDILELSAKDALRVAPAVVRAFEADADGMEILVFGPRHDGDGELIQGWWSN
jgi:mannose-6-phosphate isomerase-like protein (cupin superfamily)